MHMIGIMSLCIIYVLYVIMNKFAMVVFHYGPFKTKQKKKTHIILLFCLAELNVIFFLVLFCHTRVICTIMLFSLMFIFLLLASIPSISFSYLTFENIRVIYLDIYFQMKFALE